MLTSTKLFLLWDCSQSSRPHTVRLENYDPYTADKDWRSVFGGPTSPPFVPLLVSAAAAVWTSPLDRQVWEEFCILQEEFSEIKPPWKTLLPAEVTLGTQLYILLPCLPLPTFSFLLPNKITDVLSNPCIWPACGRPQTLRGTEVSGQEVTHTWLLGWQMMVKELSSSFSGSKLNESLSLSTFSRVHGLRNCNFYLLPICQT